MTSLPKPVSLRPLQAFAEIIRTGSATAAGRELGLTQSVVSRMIAQLEADLGFDLFWRDKGRLVPTKDGLSLAEEVELALAGVARVDSLARDIAGFERGELKLVAPPSFTQTILPDIAAQFLSHYPKVRLSFDSRSVETARMMIATRVVDGGFLKLPVERSDIHVERIVSSETACIMPFDHPLAKYDTLTPEELFAYPLISLSARREVQSAVERAFRNIGRRPTIVVDTTTVGSACALAARGLGIAIVNSMLADSFLGTDLISRPFRPMIQQDYAFATSATSAISRLTAEFMRFTKDYLMQKNNTYNKLV